MRKLFLIIAMDFMNCETKVAIKVLLPDHCDKAFINSVRYKFMRFIPEVCQLGPNVYNCYYPSIVRDYIYCTGFSY